MTKNLPTREADIQQAIRLELGNPESYPDVRLWPNPCGVLQDKDGRYVRYGVANPGGSDLVGIFKRRDGVGMWIGAEIKSATGKQRDEQKRHEELITKMGGSYAVLRSVEDAKRWIAGLRSE